MTYEGQFLDELVVALAPYIKPDSVESAMTSTIS